MQSKVNAERRCVMNPKLEKLIAEIKPDTVDESFLTGEVTDHMVDQIKAILQLKQLFPSLTYSRRGQSESKKQDIKVFLNQNYILTLSPGNKQCLGRVCTDYVTDDEAKNALVLEGYIGMDPEPDTLFTKYRKREKWTQKYYKNYDSVAKMKEEIIQIIEIAISKGVIDKTFFSIIFEKIKNNLKSSNYSVKVASLNRIFIFFKTTKQPCVIVNIDNASTGSNVLECTQGVYKSISNEIGKYIQATSKNGYSYAVNAYEEEILSIISCLKNTELTTIDTNKTSDGETMTTQSFDKNMILYGPPGTGKTYSTAIYAVAICDGKSIDELTDYEAVMRRYNELKSAGRVAFTTFHQSYGYEEFIEGIKPKLGLDSEKLGFTIEDGVFKAFCNRAKAVKVQATTETELKEEPRIWGMLLGGTGMTELKKQCFENGEIRLGWGEVDDSDVDGEIIADADASWSAKHMVADFKNSMEIGDLVVIEKTNKSIDAIGVITGDYVYDESQSKYPRSREVKWLVKNIDYNVVPFLKGRKQLSRFSLFAFDYIGLGNILEILNKYQKNPIVEAEKETKPYVFVIDEINRGNISKIFGELITLIEDTKREGMSEAASATLPYSGEPFSIPENVYLLGTMNTADRSIALMDTALRRRFSFEELMPDADVLRKIGADKVGDLDVAAMLEAINERITFLYDREHTIGHAFFTKLKDVPTLETLKTIFKKSVIPLLQEYFYEDYQKIQLVLGDNGKTDDSLKFITDEKVVIRNIFKGHAEDVIDIDRKYSINDAAFDNPESYKQII